MGYSHIPRQHAQPINAFYENIFNPWLNLHRPSLFATEIVNEKGKVKKLYHPQDAKTPLEALVLLAANDKVKFKTGQSLEQLEIAAAKQTDLQAAQQMQKAKFALFAGFNKALKRA
jgi:hypothetical protein